MSNTPIADHALLSDRHSSALVDRAGSVEWLSFPRFDSPSVFGRMERAAAYANDLGLLAEEVDPDTGAMLGNFPQAFSHIGLVNAAWAISQAEQRAR